MPCCQGLKKESFHSVFQGSRPCQHLGIVLLTSRTVKSDISLVYTNLVCGPLLQQPWQTNTPLILSFLRSGFNSNHPNKKLPAKQTSGSGPSDHSIDSFWPVDHPSVSFSTITFWMFFLTFLNSPFYCIPSTVAGSVLCVMQKKKKICKE